ncbi:MAG: hypothetical protein LUH56_06935 [Oscillospiraceae bacterium]|nr:hypothetical protein [Oscillospiraceae bacterium]
MLDGRDELFYHVVVPVLVPLDSASWVAVGGIGLVVDDIDRIDGHTPLVNPLRPVINHTEVLEVEKPTALTGDKYNRLSRMPIDFKFHISHEIAAVMFMVFNIHSLISPFDGVVIASPERGGEPPPKAVVEGFTTLNTP